MRYLRSSLVQPSTDLATITARLDAVSEVRPWRCLLACTRPCVALLLGGTSALQALSYLSHARSSPQLLERPESLCDAKKVLPAFKDSDRLLKFFMQKPTQVRVCLLSRVPAPRRLV